VDVLWAACDLAESGTNSREYEAVAERLREKARETGDPRSEARALLTLAFVHHVSGSRFDVAVQEAEQATELAETAEDPLTSCWASNAGGAIAMYQGRYEDGERHFTRALENFRAVGDRPGEASALCNLSRTHLATGRTESAVALAQQGTAMYDGMGHALKGANGRYALGLALTQSGKLSEATECLQEALRVFQDSRQHLWEGMTVFRLAELDLTARRPAQAAANAEMALTLLRGVGGEWRHGNVLTVLGRALTGIGQLGRAQVCWREALDIFEALKAPEADEVRGLLKPRSVA
jgi:tetratricopeptide (TPR) repeat protein